MHGVVFEDVVGLAGKEDLRSAFVMYLDDIEELSHVYIDAGDLKDKFLCYMSIVHDVAAVIYIYECFDEKDRQDTCEIVPLLIELLISLAREKWKVTGDGGD